MLQGIPTASYDVALASAFCHYTISMDDVYNHLKVYDPEVQKKSKSNSQNMAFISSSNTSSGKGEVHTASVPTASTDVAAASLSHDTVCAYIASQSNGSQIKYEDITQIDEDDIEKIHIKWNMALLSMRTDRFWKKTGKKITIQGFDVAGFDKSKVEAKLVEFKEQEIKFCEKIRGLERDVEVRNNKIEYLMNELEQEVKDQIRTKRVLDTMQFPPSAQVYSPPKKDLSWTGLPEFVDDTVTDYKSSGSIMSKPMIKFVKATDCPRVTKTNNTKNARKSTVKYAEMYRNTSKSPKVRGETWPKNNYTHKTMTPRAVLLKPGTTPIVISRPKMNVAQPKMTSFAKTAHSNGNSQNNIDDKGYWNSGCSRHMTGNLSYLFEYEPYDGGYVSFGQGGGKIIGKGIIKTDFKLKDDTNVLLRTPRQHNMYSIDLNNIVPDKNLTCLVSKASVNESTLWHRRLGHLNFKTMNKLVRNNLVKGLPSKCFENDHTCVAFLKGKQHKASCKTKLVNYVSKPLHTLHMNLFGPTSVSSLNHKWYCLVVTDDFSRGEFKNKEMNEFCTKKGIKREFSNARTPRQNGVA
nr:hypothetical protein [Tanacetum cinerariifolium]